MLQMERRECALRVELDEWAEALEAERDANAKLRRQLQQRSSELEQQRELAAVKQAETSRSASSISSPLLPFKSTSSHLDSVC